MERDRFERLAYLDPLTGVANRRTFDETLLRMWNVARRAGYRSRSPWLISTSSCLNEHKRKVVERDGGITISVGIASRVPAPGDDPLALVAGADDALYRAKHEGRNCVRVAVAFVSPLTVP